ncbi:hypothetical protein ACVWXN_007888 [Bradyrhizobium sp. i1.4.4]
MADTDTLETSTTSDEQRSKDELFGRLAAIGQDMIACPRQGFRDWGPGAAGAVSGRGQRARQARRADDRRVDERGEAEMTIGLVENSRGAASRSVGISQASSATTVSNGKPI